MNAAISARFPSKRSSRAVRMCLTSFLESDVLERLSGDPVETGCLGIVTPAAREIAAGDPGAGPVTDRGHLLEHRVGGEEALLGLVEAIALEQGAAEHELGLADLVEEVLAALEQGERLAGVFVR